MADTPSARQMSFRALVALLVAIAASGMARARATNLFNVYAGAAYARATLRARDSNPLAFSGSGPLSSFNRSGSGYQLSLGVRGLELLGAEVDYFDLGSVDVANAHTLAGTPGTVSDATLAQKGEALFAMLYLPIPVVDVYLKAGVDRITSDLGARFTPECPLPLPFNPVCGPETLALHATTTGLAVGAGAQWQFGNWGVRAEYERFTALGEHPDLVSVGVIWTFL